jgi:hypothetical protein
MTPELQSKVLIWRKKAEEGTLTIDEMREAVQALREGRVSASAASDKSRAKKAAKVIPNADDLLSEIGDI